MFYLIWSILSPKQWQARQQCWAYMCSNAILDIGLIAKYTPWQVLESRRKFPKWRARQKRRNKQRERSRVELYNVDQFKGVNFKEEPNCSNHEDIVQVDVDYNIEEDLQNSSPPSKKIYRIVRHRVRRSMTMFLQYVTKQMMGFLRNIAILATA